MKFGADREQRPHGGKDHGHPIGQEHVTRPPGAVKSDFPRSFSSADNPHSFARPQRRVVI